MDKPSSPASNKPPENEAKNWLTYSGMAFEFFAIIGIFTAIGFFLDKKFATKPVLVIVFLLIGLAASFYRIFKQFSKV
jgi:F0F1-type ATP synthase assembly protein I